MEDEGILWDGDEAGAEEVRGDDRDVDAVDVDGAGGDVEELEEG